VQNLVRRASKLVCLCVSPLNPALPANLQDGACGNVPSATLTATFTTAVLTAALAAAAATIAASTTIATAATATITATVTATTFAYAPADATKRTTIAASAATAVATEPMRMDERAQLRQPPRAASTKVVLRAGWFGPGLVRTLVCLHRRRGTPLPIRRLPHAQAVLLRSDWRCMPKASTSLGATTATASTAAVASEPVTGAAFEAHTAF